MESNEKEQVVLSIESKEHKRYLQLNDGVYIVRVRIPLQILSEELPKERREFLMKPYCIEAYNKLMTLKEKNGYLQ